MSTSASSASSASSDTSISMSSSGSSDYSYSELEIYENHRDLPTYDDIYKSSISSKRKRKLDKVLDNYDINITKRDKIYRLAKFDIVLVIDDSKSMKSLVEVGKTRWQEAMEYAKPIIEIGSAIDSDGIDIIFLNGREKTGVTKYSSSLFPKKMTRGTPLGKATRTAFKKKNDKPLLVIVLTDGSPSDMTDDEYRELIRHRDGANIFMTFVACTNNRKKIKYLNKIDVEDCTLDVVDDYHNEYKEVIDIQGKNFDYSFEDHIIRLLLGPVYPEFDKLDEMPITKVRL
jgi:hypothetical protein